MAGDGAWCSSGCGAVGDGGSSKAEWGGVHVDRRLLPSITDRLTIITLMFALTYMAGLDRAD
jgi:hypothetical protein